MTPAARLWRDWLPVRLDWADGRPVLDWRYFGDARFTEPFFNETVERLLRHPFNQLFQRQTPIETLAELQPTAPPLAPDGFIFHMSRCGSTLITQMLAAAPQTIVISEAPPLDSILRARFRTADVTDEQRARWLRWMISAYGRRRRTAESRYFIKFDCWHTLDLPLIQNAFPDAPWVFVFREPVEVIVSQLRRRGAQMLPWVVEPQLFGLELAEALRLPPEEYFARVLAAICRAALQNEHAGRSLFINYRQLPGAVEAKLLNHFRVVYTADELARMRRAAERDAKNPAMPFADETDAKRRAATATVQQAADRHLGELYQQLEARALRAD